MRRTIGDDGGLWARGAMAGLALILGACGEDTTGQVVDTGAGSDATTPLFDVLQPDTAFATDTAPAPDSAVDDADATDADSGDAAADADAEPGSFGTPCQNNPECASGYCVEGPDGFVCTRQCQADCPAGYDCKGIQDRTDVVFLCLPRLDRLCAPCTEDLQCGGGRCLDIDGEQRCARPCVRAEDCPTSFACVPDGEASNAGFCQPATGSCSCFAEVDGGLRTCASENAFGTCFGVSDCDPEVGWSTCSAKTPAAETCNGTDDDCDAFVDEDLAEVGQACTVDVAGVGSCAGQTVCAGVAGIKCQGPTPTAETCDFSDNDCDGSVDEDFKTGDVYATFEHCGTCNRSCAIGFPNAAQTACQIDHGVAQCVVVSCDDGYIKQNDFQCIPDVVNLCEPCSSDANCLGQGSACVTLSDGSFCAKACVGNGNCPLGFSCQEVGEASKQCVPTTGVCSCGPTTQGLSRACSVTVSPAGQPSYTCAGSETCSAAGWGSCVLPVEACNGVDDDCDGNTDEGFRNASGKYDKVDNCGACGVSCLALDYVNSAPVCDASAAGLPRCSYQCDNGWVDVDAAPGCDCHPTSTTDLPDDLGVDADCDGIDGEIGKSVFVAKTGDDAGLGTIDDPLRTIAAGIAKAQLLGRRDVLVATGVYEESVTLVDGVSVYGGYAPAFSERDRSRHESALLGAAPTDAQRGAVNAVSVGQNAAKPITFDGFSVFGANNPAPGGNSYAIYLRNVGANITISHDYVVAGDGGAGAAGAKGGDGADGNDGSPGVGAESTGSTCTVANHAAGGNGGAQICDGTDTSGGNGGTRVCPVAPNPVQTSTQTPTAQEYGHDGKLNAGSGGEPGWHDRIQAAGCGSVSIPQLHDDVGAAGGAGQNGLNGNSAAACSASAGVVDSNGQWKGPQPGAGQLGAHGSGGGGGGAGSGIDHNSVCTTPYVVGSSGGGGGAGGCRGAVGASGMSGGGSFGIFVTYTSVPASLPTIRENLVLRGIGGRGGAGGAGGVGGAGGFGAEPGPTNHGTQPFPLVCCSSSGGAGGNGGRGGHGPGGAGGCGGATFGMYLDPVAASLPKASISENVIPAAGAAGSGAPGGTSLGNVGLTGSNGVSSARNY